MSSKTACLLGFASPCSQFCNVVTPVCKY
uniref:Uncharacterized protein n=1 Tax=Providencia alcalifaciens TaxID=126385 RepID=H7C8G1_9GAMM|nr:hypothetical protein [Providencia alcalifaciens]